MARKLTEKPTVSPDTIPPDLVARTVATIRDKKQALADAQMDHASEYKTAERRGFHSAALKKAVAYAKMEPAKRLAEIAHLKHYIGVLDLDKNPQQNLFGDEMPSHDDIKEAVGEINMGPAIPDPAIPDDYQGKARLTGAFERGIEARRANQPRECKLTSEASIAAFERGWDAMDAAFLAAESGATSTAVTEDDRNALLLLGINRFRKGLDATGHGDTDPVRAAIIQEGWETERKAQASAEPELSEDEITVLKQEGADACEAAKPQSACPYPAGSAKADAWLQGYEAEDGGLFDEGADAVTNPDPGPGESGEVLYGEVLVAGEADDRADAAVIPAAVQDEESASEAETLADEGDTDEDDFPDLPDDDDAGDTVPWAVPAGDAAGADIFGAE